MITLNWNTVWADNVTGNGDIMKIWEPVDVWAM